MIGKGHQQSKPLRTLRESLPYTNQVLSNRSVPEPEAMIGRASECSFSPYVEVESYAGSRLPLRLAAGKHVL
jgi:hypothetical protein